MSFIIYYNFTNYQYVSTRFDNQYNTTKKPHHIDKIMHTLHYIPVIQISCGKNETWAEKWDQQHWKNYGNVNVSLESTKLSNFRQYRVQIKFNFLHNCIYRFNDQSFTQYCNINILNKLKVSLCYKRSLWIYWINEKQISLHSFESNSRTDVYIEWNRKPIL